MQSVNPINIFDIQSDSELTRRERQLRTHLKLIDLYQQHECLWMERHKDFFNFALKEEIWEQIANDMIDPTKSDQAASTHKWKCIIHRLRYNVQLEQLHKEEAKFLNFEKVPSKLRYSEKLQFLFKHMFDKKEKKKSVTPQLDKKTAFVPHQESLAAKCMRMGRNKIKSSASCTYKLKTLEKMRNRLRTTLSLTPEAFHKLQMLSPNVTDMK